MGVNNRDKILLIDANSVLYRIFFSTKKLLKDEKYKKTFFDNDGQPINILKSFIEIFVKYKTKVFCDYNIIVVFDHPENKTYRNEFSFYKANRKKDEDYYTVFLPQYKSILQFLSLFKVKTFQSKSLEADDIIGILSDKFSKLNKEVEIITSDKDLFQLINDNVSVNLLIQGKKKFTKVDFNNLKYFVGPNNKSVDFDIKPKQIIDLKSINGDNSDNIPGLFLKVEDEEENSKKIKKIPFDMAIELLKKHESIENLIEYSKNKIDDSLYRQVYNQKAKLVRNKYIVKIITDFDKEIKNIQNIEFGSINFRNLYLFLGENNLNHIIRIIKERKPIILNGCPTKTLPMKEEFVSVQFSEEK